MQKGHVEKYKTETMLDWMHLTFKGLSNSALWSNWNFNTTYETFHYGQNFSIFTRPIYFMEYLKNITAFRKDHFNLQFFVDF